MEESTRHEWRNEPPKEDGDFFYSGPLPRGENILAIVQVFTYPVSKDRMACVFIPPGWRGDMSRREPVVHFGKLDEWKGEWAGPEYGLCAVNSKTA